MASIFELIHHPEAAREFRETLAYFKEIDTSMAQAFETDFVAALRGMASGKAVSTLYASGSCLRWIKLRRFSHKIFFEPLGESSLLVLGIISGKRAPRNIKETLDVRTQPKG